MPTPDIKADLLVALDVIEHLNPNKLPAYLERLGKWLAPNGFAFVNLPAFGPDDVFGCVHTFWVEAWRDDFARGTIFSSLLCDESGYPHCGHLIWAGTNWWEKTFAQFGFAREREIERILHDIFDPWLTSEARRSSYVLVRGDCPDLASRRAEIVRRALGYDVARLKELRERNAG
jgi:hypothetical protein